jgi:poly-gamma-glutamate synthesis protein (capsule biosynthesis protein)
VLVFAFACESAGVPPEWQAGPAKAGVNLMESLSEREVERVRGQVEARKRPYDLAVASIHWGGNWGYRVPAQHVAFARALIDSAGIDLVHGHSSHHPLRFERYRGKLILYGCGDFLNDYEGIGGYEVFRSELTWMYFPTLDRTTGALSRLLLVPMRIRNFRLNRVNETESHWLETTLLREAGELGLALSRQADGSLSWQLAP